MKTFYRGFTIKTTLVKGSYGYRGVWAIYARRGIVRDDNRSILKGGAKRYRDERSEAQRNIDALLSGCAVKRYRKNKGGGGRNDFIQLTEDQINLILTDEIFHEVCS